MPLIYKKLRENRAGTWVKTAINRWQEELAMKSLSFFNAPNVLMKHGTTYQVIQLYGNLIESLLVIIGRTIGGDKVWGDSAYSLFLVAPQYQNIIAPKRYLLYMWYGTHTMHTQYIKSHSNKNWLKTDPFLWHRKPNLKFYLCCSIFVKVYPDFVSLAPRIHHQMINF